MPKSTKKIKGEFFPFYHKNWREGVEYLSPEQRGIYIDLLAAMWMRKAALPHDVGRIAKHIRVDVRVLKRVLPTLISEDKIKLVDGFLTNKRMMEEILRYLKRTPSADTPETDEDDYASDDTCGADVEEMSDTCGADEPDLFGKSNEISTVGAIEERSKNLELRKEDSQPASSVEQEPAGGRAGASPEIVILKSIADWTADESRARSWVTAHVGLYGLDVVRDAVAVVVAEIAAGRHVAQPVQLASSVIRRLDAKKPGPGEPHDKPATVPPWAADKSARGRSVDDVLAQFYAEKRARLEAEAAA